LNWHIHRGHVIIPKTSKVERLRENIDVFNFNMTVEEYESITALDQNARFYDPETEPPEFGFNSLPYFH
jgi:D-xylose reductase